MSMQDYLPHVTQVFSKSRSCRWSISVLASIPSSILILSTPRAIVYRVRWNQEPRRTGWSVGITPSNRILKTETQPESYSLVISYKQDVF